MKNMKKYFFTILIISSFSVCAFAQSDLSTKIIESAKKDLAFYQKAETCTPSEKFGMTVIGKSQGNCHYKYANLDCYAPMSVMKKYAEENIANMNEIIRSIIRSGSLKMTYDSKDDYMYNYC